MVTGAPYSGSGTTVVPLLSPLPLPLVPDSLAPDVVGSGSFSGQPASASPTSTAEAARSSPPSAPRTCDPQCGHTDSFDLMCSPQTGQAMRRVIGSSGGAMASPGSHAPRSRSTEAPAPTTTRARDPAIARPPAPAQQRLPYAAGMNKDPVFVAYALTVVVNSLNILVLWNFSGGTRGKTRTTPNPEDARTVVKGAQVVASDPDSVARVLRAHRNTADNTLPFLLLALVFVQLRPDPLEAQILLGTFTGARIFYTICYLGQIQPWRTITYGIGVLATLALVVEILRALFT